jgi:DNA invertase Pin-like site-specific DNA recombinase/predicted RNA-binding Zn-ribbon protein involved in translation (DUF1610 family)
LDEEPVTYGLIYARASSGDSESVSDQIEFLTDIAAQRDIELICDPISEKGETGTNFDRAGFQKVVQHVVQDDVDYVLIDDISRLGRNAPLTIYLIYVFAVEYDTKILTDSGEVDVTQVDDLVQSMMLSLNAHLATNYRTRSSVRSKVRNFTEDKQWRSRYDVVPVGYRLKDDGWIESDPAEVEIARAMFTHFIESGSYRATARCLTSEYGKEDNLIKDSGEEFDERFRPARIKNFVSRRVYIGQPTITCEGSHTEQDVYQLDEPELAIIGQDRFDQAQRVKDKINSKNTTDKDAIDPDSAIQEFGLLAVLESSPIIELVCPDCGGELRANGQRELDGSARAHNYQCTECGRQRKWPYLSELESMKELSPAVDVGQGAT